MKIYVVEVGLNKEIYKFLNSKKYNLEKDMKKILSCQVIILSKVKNNKQSLQIIELALQNGIEIICVKPVRCKEDFLCNMLIRDGAFFI